MNYYVGSKTRHVAGDWYINNVGEVFVYTGTSWAIVCSEPYKFKPVTQPLINPEDIDD